MWRTKLINKERFQGSTVTFGQAGIYPVITNVEMDIVHQNGGEGTPTPTNIRPIIGYSEGAVIVNNEDYTESTRVATSFPTDKVPGGEYMPIFEGHFNITTGELTITGMVITLEGTENWAQYGDYMCMDLTGYNYVKNDRLQSDRYVYADATDNGFYISDTDNFVDYGVVMSMHAE